MRGVMVDVPPSLLAERRRLGHDLFDEMWEGELHMVPAPNEEHQRIGTLLAAALLPIAQATGLHLRYETSVFDPAVPAHTSYRTPDLVVFDEAVRSRRGVEGAARLVVEIRSPGDESLEKLPFFERVGVMEVLIIDRDSKAIRRWTNVDGTLAEVRAADEHELGALAVRLRVVDGTLVIEPSTGPATTI